MSFVIGFSILVMFAWMQLEERKKEIYTERALGMKLVQLSGLFLVELLVLMISGILIGGAMGWSLSQFLQSFDTQGPTFIPYQIIYPMNLIFESFSILFILALGGQFSQHTKSLGRIFLVHLLQKDNITVNRYIKVELVLIQYKNHIFLDKYLKIYVLMTR